MREGTCPSDSATSASTTRPPLLFDLPRDAEARAGQLLARPRFDGRLPVGVKPRHPFGDFGRVVGAIRHAGGFVRSRRSSG